LYPLTRLQVVLVRPHGRILDHQCFAIRIK
jgi:hypothetical protein